VSVVQGVRMFTVYSDVSEAQDKRNVTVCSDVGLRYRKMEMLLFTVMCV